MPRTEDSRNPQVWEAALKDAAGLFSAYLTPQDYGLASLRVQGTEEDNTDPFLTEIHRRIDLGRAASFTEMVESLTGGLTTQFRQTITYCKQEIRGKVHMPRYVITHARNPEIGIPVTRAERHPATPENLLVSEAIRRSLVITRAWWANRSAEGNLARNLNKRLQRVEAQQPWSDLRILPRDSFRGLLRTVKSRVATKMVRRQPIERVIKLFDVEDAATSAFESSAELLTLLVTEHPEFEDKLFELLCLGWILNAVKTCSAKFQVWPSRLTGAKGKALMVGIIGTGTVEVYFQAGTILPEGRWHYQPRNTALKAIVDIVCRVQRDAASECLTYLLDAKNRGQNDSEVIYKLLGYKENLGLQPFHAVGIFPGFRGKLELKRLTEGDNHVWILRVPLLKGRRIFTRLTERVIASYYAAPA
jgi:hypothetical protein